MKKLREYLIKWIDGQKVRGINVTPYDVEECIRVYNAIVRKEKPEFINEKVKKSWINAKLKRLKKESDGGLCNGKIMLEL